MLKPQYRGAVQPVREECHGINSCYRTLAPAKIGKNLKENIYKLYNCLSERDFCASSYRMHKNLIMVFYS